MSGSPGANASDDVAQQQRSARAVALDAASGHRTALGLMAVTSFLGGIAEAVFLVAVTRAAFAITDGDERVGVIAGWTLSVNQALAVATSLVLVRVAIAGLAAWQSARLSSSAVAEIRLRLIRAFLRSSWATQQQQAAGSLQELVGSYSSQAAGLMNSIGQGTVAVANLIAMLGLAVGIDPAGALVMVVSVVLLGSILRPVRSIVRRRARASNIAGMQLSVAVSEASQLGMELHVFHVQQQAEDRLKASVRAAKDRTRDVQFASGTASSLYSGLAYLALLAALAFVAASPSASLTSLGAVMLVMLRSLSYGQIIQGALLGISSAAPALDELAATLKHFDVGTARSSGGPVGVVRELSVHDLSFQYATGQTVLKDVSFAAREHEVIGIVGPSGSGKSTLVQLLLGLRDPDAGCVAADGRDLRTLDLAEWARRVTFVPQASHLITGTIAENIAFMRDGVSREDVERAARMAHVHDDIVAMTGGYDRQLGAGQAHLSGGQQQRLCIARALIETPDVLILDEPTSALDVRSEHLIRSTLRELSGEMTVLIIAHRLSTLDICDRIMVIQDGRLVAFDSPAELERSNEFYREALRLSGLQP